MNNKKRTRFCGFVLILTVLICTLTGVVSAAELPSPSILNVAEGFIVEKSTFPNVIHVECTTGSDRLQPGAEYVIMMVADNLGNQINETTIQYIDQQTAEENGNVKFEINPKMMQDAQILISGIIDGEAKQIQIAEIKAIQLGDADLKDGVTPDDALVVLRHALKVAEIKDSIALAAADVNGDGSVTMADAVQIMRYVLNAIPVL